jgi:dTDP-4-amino-4,6-dideoxygalactose transaminase
MLQAFLPLAVRLKAISPASYYFLVRVAKRLFGSSLGVYPRVMGDELGAIEAVLRGSQWNMAYGRGLAHERLEAKFAESTGSKFAIAVASGGVAIQMSLRALGLKPGDEVIHQVDTCSATAMAVMNAGCTPIFADIAEASMMLDIADVRARLGEGTRAILGTHMWGNPEDMPALRRLADEKGLPLIEDACLGLGTISGGRQAGSWGDVGVFSFGCIKPIQTGEGGMIVTADESLARELRSMRHWGDRTIEYGVRDATTLAWNGRMSEILAALAHEQLTHYPRHLATMRNAVSDFQAWLEPWPGLSLVLGSEPLVANAAFTQVVMRIDENKLGIDKNTLSAGLSEKGVSVWHANFELINSLSLFRNGSWRDWILRGDLDRVGRNYAEPFPIASRVLSQTGIGLGKTNFLSTGNLKHLKTTLESILTRASVT